VTHRLLTRIGHIAIGHGVFKQLVKLASEAATGTVLNDWVRLAFAPF
jgi:hypothetical protein